MMMIGGGDDGGCRIAIVNQTLYKHYRSAIALTPSSDSQTIDNNMPMIYLDAVQRAKHATQKNVVTGESIAILFFATTS